MIETETVFGGIGADAITLFGQSGNTVKGSAGGDTINGFATGNDSIFLNSAIGTEFAGGNGVLAVRSFVKGTGAMAGDSDGFYFFDTTTSILKFDADADGADAAFDIASIINNNLVNIHQ